MADKIDSIRKILEEGSLEKEIIDYLLSMIEDYRTTSGTSREELSEIVTPFLSDSGKNEDESKKIVEDICNTIGFQLDKNNPPQKKKTNSNSPQPTNQVGSTALKTLPQRIQMESGTTSNTSNNNNNMENDDINNRNNNNNAPKSKQQRKKERKKGADTDININTNSNSNSNSNSNINSNINSNTNTNTSQEKGVSEDFLSSRDDNKVEDVIQTRNIRYTIAYI